MSKMNTTRLVLAARRAKFVRGCAGTTTGIPSIKREEDYKVSDLSEEVASAMRVIEAKRKIVMGEYENDDHPLTEAVKKLLPALGLEPIPGRMAGIIPTCVREECRGPVSRGLCLSCGLIQDHHRC